MSGYRLKLRRAIIAKGEENRTMKIDADNVNLQYCGRIDWKNPKEPVFVYPCTSVGMKFTGNELKVIVKNKNAYWNNYLGCILDGKQMSLQLPKDGIAVIDIPIDKNGNIEHEVLIFKRQDSCHELTMLGFEIDDDGQVIYMPEKPKRKIEVYGDSVSAGEVSEAIDYVGKSDPEHNGEYSNSWYSYAWITARKLNAQIHDIAQGGIALSDKTGWFMEPEAIGMETVWDKIHYNPIFGAATNWDFTQYIPQVVIVAIGQNDSHPQDYMKDGYNGMKAVKWREQYGKFLKQIRKKYPSAWIICCTTLLEHDISWDNSIDEVVQSINDSKVLHYMFERNGKGTPGHLRISEAEEMAEELTAYIESLDIEGWD